LADIAKEAGADMVKYQTFNTSKLLRKDDPAYEALYTVELSRTDFKTIANHCRDIEIEFVTTPGDPDSLRFAVEELGVSRIKIGSDDLPNTALLRAAAATDLPIILSTGMAEVCDIDSAVRTISRARPSGAWSKLTLLHCVSLYPCPPELANISAIKHMQKVFSLPIGYSDHTGMAMACVMAAAFGAQLVEAHIMLAHTDPLDKLVSYDPASFKGLVKALRYVDLIYGNGFKSPAGKEMAVRKQLYKGSDGYRGLI
jgi:sialic acid synthase SpsE